MTKPETLNTAGAAKKAGAVKIWIAGGVAVLSMLVLAGCAADAGADAGSPPSAGADVAAPPTPDDQPTVSGVVLGQGTVLQVNEALPQFCLGGVAESYPPQCSGPEIVAWDWTAVDQFETASGVTWGTFAVQGTWDGSRLTVTESPVPLSLFDPMVVPDPLLDPANPGPTSDERLAQLQNEVVDLGLPGLLGAQAVNGYLFVDVIHDPQPTQSILDTRFGPSVAVVRPALKPVG